MTFTHIALSITEFVGSYGTRYICSLFTDNGKTHSFREIPIDEARLLQWDLIAKGAAKIEEYNPFNSHIHTRQIRLIKL